MNSSVAPGPGFNVRAPLAVAGRVVALDVAWQRDAPDAIHQGQRLPRHRDDDRALLALPLGQELDMRIGAIHPDQLPRLERPPRAREAAPRLRPRGRVR